VAKSPEVVLGFRDLSDSDGRATLRADRRGGKS